MYVTQYNLGTDINVVTMGWTCHPCGGLLWINDKDRHTNSWLGQKVVCSGSELLLSLSCYSGAASSWLW
jgi:hypothetical protein